MTPNELFPDRLSRRALLRCAGLVSGALLVGGLLAACASPSSPAPTAAKSSASSAPQRPLKLPFASFTAVATEPGNVHMKTMADEVGKQTNGALEMPFFPGTLLTKEMDVYNAVKAGSVALGAIGGGAATAFPELEPLLVPYLFRDYDHAYKVLYGPIGDQLVKTIESKYGVKVVLWHDYGFRNFLTAKKAIRTPDDMKGLKMRVMQGATYADAVNAFGASAVPMAWGEVVTAAQQGVIDGYDLPVFNIYATKAWEVAKYVTMSMYSFGATTVIMNQGIWQGLTPQEQKIITDLGRQVSQKVRDDYENGDKNAKTELPTKGMEVIYPDMELFRKIAAEKVWPKYKDQAGDLLDRIAAVK